MQEELQKDDNLELAILDMEAAGMTDKSEHILTGSLPFGQFSIPQHIYLIGEYLYFWDDLGYSRDTASDAGALDALVRIKTPDDVLRFAHRYGPLGLCKHGLPPMHRGSRYQDEFVDGEWVGVTDTGEWNPASGGDERGWCPPCNPESIKRWLAYSNLALSYLNLAAGLKTDKALPARGLRQGFLKDGVNEWLGDAGVRLELNWSGGEPELTLTGGGVFGALGVQLLTAVTHHSLAVCSGCRKPYLRKARKPKQGERNFCPDCGSKVASRLRQLDWRKGDPDHRKNKGRHHAPRKHAEEG